MSMCACLHPCVCPVSMKSYKTTDGISQTVVVDVAEGTYKLLRF